MAKFTDLSNELVFTIASFIRKPSDILRLCFAERRSYELIRPLLYENVVFNCVDYPTNTPGNWLRSMSYDISLFCRCIKQQLKRNEREKGDGPTFRSECRSLAIYFDERLTHAKYGVVQVCGFVPFLKSFTLITNPPFDDPNTDFNIDNLGRALQPLRHTLESLTLFIRNQYVYWYNEDLSSLYYFTAMKKLRIQSQLLRCREKGFSKNRVPMLLSQILPPKLEDLTIHCCAHGPRETEGKQDLAHHVEASLDGKSFSTRTLEPDECLAGTDRRVIESVVVCLLNVGSGGTVCGPWGLQKRFDIVGRKAK